MIYFLLSSISAVALQMTIVFDGQTNLINRFGLAECAASYKKASEECPLGVDSSQNRLLHFNFNTEFHNAKALQEAVFSGDNSILAIGNFDEAAVKSVFDLKPGPIPGFDAGLLFENEHESKSKKVL